MTSSIRLTTVLWLLLWSCEAASAQPISISTLPGTSWPATDALGRTLPTSQEVGPPRPDRFVGIFYFLWHEKRNDRSPSFNGPYDVSKILAQKSDALANPDSPLWGPRGMFHYWAEPLYGYYLATDPWVLRRHAQALADAGIDTLIFDTTNAATYPDVYHALCKVFEQVRKEGDRTPQIAFMLNSGAGETARKLYDDLYRPGIFRDLWFSWRGKPLMICDPQAAAPELQQFFTLRRAHWPFEMKNTADAWHWEATYPQPYGFTDDPNKAEQVNVSVAQNLRASDGQVTNMSSGDARGRSFHDGKLDLSPSAVNHGFNFQEQWKRAMELKPPFVMVTGWNEWIAGRWGEPGGPVVFVDQYNQEFSRDIEPMKGGHADNYYYQLVANVRRYKGVPAIPHASARKTIRIDGPFDQWRDVGPEFADHLGETLPRDWDGAAGLHYAIDTGRNDLVAFKVARDGRQLYFYARTRQPIKMGPNWMWLLLDMDCDPATGWEGYDFICNRVVEPDGKSWLEKHERGWQWSRTTPVSWRVDGNELQLAIPYAAIGLTDKVRDEFRFKWADNVRRPGDIMDFYLSGDVAPEGRFMYSFRILDR